MGTSICRDCKFLVNGYHCNRLVVSGGFGTNDKVARDFMHDNQCTYFERGKGQQRFDDFTAINSWNS